MSSRQGEAEEEVAAESEAERPAQTPAIGSVETAVGVLEALAAQGRPVGVTELARQLGEPKAKIHRHLATLRGLDLVAQDPGSERYRLGWRLFQLGQAALAQVDLPRLAEEPMARLAEAAEQTTILAIAVDGEALVAAVRDWLPRPGSGRPSAIAVTARPGLRPSPGASAQARVVLAFSAEAQRERVLARAHAAFTPYSLATREAIEARLEIVGARMWDQAPQELMIGINTVAAPVFDHAGRIAGSVGVFGSIQYLPDPPGDRIVAAVQGCAAEISARLGSGRWR